MQDNKAEIHSPLLLLLSLHQLHRGTSLPSAPNIQRNIEGSDPFVLPEQTNPLKNLTTIEPTTPPI